MSGDAATYPSTREASSSDTGPTEPPPAGSATAFPPPGPTTASTSGSASTSTRSRFYITSSSRPFSRSALQRQSVHTLPSIKHLQHGFAKMGLLAESASRPSVQGSGPAARRRKSGGVLQPVGNIVEGEEGGANVLDELGPQPDRPEVDLRMPWERNDAATATPVLKDAGQLRAEAIEALDAVCGCWSISPSPSRPNRRPSSTAMSRAPSTASDIAPLSPIDGPPPPSQPDALPLIPTLLATTTLAVRAIQALAVSLPAHSHPRSGAPPPSPPKPNPLDVSTAARPRTSLALPFSVGTGSSSGAGACRLPEGAKGREGEGEDALVGLRRTSRDVLGMLRDLEARYRLPGIREVSAEAGTTATYSADVDLPALAREGEVVERWVRVVESELERSEAVGAGAGVGARRRSGGGTAGGEGEGDDVAGEEEALPEWASETGWEDGLARAHAVTCAHAPAAQHPLPDPAVSRDAFLDALSDGTLLCHSFNSILRQSPLSRPWGFIPSSSIHVFPPAALAQSAGMERTASAASATSDGGERVGSTFRRAENLAQWSAALKHRYAHPLPPSFDPRAIAARKPDVDWRGMLAEAVTAWGTVAAREAREVWAARRGSGAGEQGAAGTGEGR